MGIYLHKYNKAKPSVKSNEIGRKVEEILSMSISLVYQNNELKDQKLHNLDNASIFQIVNLGSNPRIRTVIDLLSE